MKTILYVLGALFVLSRLNQSGVTVAGTVTASPFGTTPAGGAAGIIVGATDPYAGVAYGAGGGAGIPANLANIGSSFGTNSFTPRPPIGPMIGPSHPLRTPLRSL